MPRLTRLHSFLDRLEERLEVDCERLKRQLLAQVDGRFLILRENVAQLRNQFGCGGMPRSARSAQVELCDDPPVETVSLEQYIQEPTAAVQSQQSSTSTGRKRQSSSPSQSVNNKRQKSVISDGSNKHLCKSAGCGKSFRYELDLSRHERIHLSIKPFSCTWQDCKYSSKQRIHVVEHIRMVHFKLPKTVKKQNELNIEDHRDPNEFFRVDQKLISRRL